MEQLIPVINKLQDVFNTVGTSEVLQLPQIVVVGAQSSGKSSVLENIVGRDFLPRGTGIVTRMPLVLQLIHTTPGGGSGLDAVTVRRGREKRGSASADAGSEFAEFLHKPGQRFTDFNKVRDEISARTVEITGENKGISKTPINLKIYSPHVLNLTLVDLPGITKVAVGDQPVDIEDQIRDLVLHYVRNPNSIILAVSPANSDIANSDSLKMAKEVDPAGDRTIGVITKLDLMDKGTDATDILSGRVIPIKLGLIGVVNRSQFDIDHSKTIKDALRAENEFFSQTYPSIAHRCGTRFLSVTLNRVLMHHIRRCLPDLKLRIKQMQSEAQCAMDSFGNPFGGEVDQGAILLHILTKFSDTYRSSINGTSGNASRELTGGARICHIFHEVFGKTLQSLDAMEGLSTYDIQTAIQNSMGTRHSLFVPEIAFETLVKRQIGMLEDPALRCVELVYEELDRLMRACVSQEMAHFRVLREEVIGVVSELLRCRVPAANEMVKSLVSIELAYINTNHPDFEGGSGAIIKMLQRLAGDAEASKPEPESESAVAAAKPAAAPKPKPAPTPQSPEQRAGFWFFGGAGGAKKPRSPASTDLILTASNDDFADPSQRQFSPPSAPVDLTDKEQTSIELIESLIRSYFGLTRKNIQDSVPKAIMRFLVNEVQEKIQNDLVRRLYKKELFEKLLAEDPTVAQQREATREMLNALNRAATIVAEVGEGGFM